jgi:hypothetical protein
MGAVTIKGIVTRSSVEFRYAFLETPIAKPGSPSPTKRDPGYPRLRTSSIMASGNDDCTSQAFGIALAP